MKGNMIVLTPLKTHDDHQILRIHREHPVDGFLHISGRPFAGLVLNESGLPPCFEIVGDCDLTFQAVFSNTEGKKVRDNISLFFEMEEGVSAVDGKAKAEQFFYPLIQNLPGDHPSFLNLVMAALEKSCPEIRAIVVEIKVVGDVEKETTNGDSEPLMEKVTPGNVQELLEHAFPNGLTVEILAKSLKCTEKEVTDHLHVLRNEGIARLVVDEWIRVDAKKIDGSLMPRQTGPDARASPTIAIITFLFVEKQAIDSLIEDSHSIHRYKSGGDSNIYTIGKIGSHQVVATKLATIGSSRTAKISAGSITTRLLGNYQNIQHVFIVGVGGGVANLTDASLHARRGDVVVSASLPHNYIYAHDLLRDQMTEEMIGFAIRKWTPVDTTIGMILEDADAELVETWMDLNEKTTKTLRSSTDGLNWEAPPQSSDILTLPLSSGQYMTIPHPETNRTGPTLHVGLVGAIAKLQNIPAEKQIKAKKMFIESHNVCCLDAGFDSVVAACIGSCVQSWVLVRGICDYESGQSPSGKSWQPLAAVRAATMTKCLIEKLPKSN